MTTKYDSLKESIFKEANKICSGLNWNPSDEKLLGAWETLKSIIDTTGLFDEHKEIIAAKHKEMIDYINQALTTLPCKVTLVKDDNIKRWEFDGGYILYEVMSSDAAEILNVMTGGKIIWSVANGFEGGANTYDSIAEYDNLARSFVDEAVKVIRRIQTGEYKPTGNLKK